MSSRKLPPFCPKILRRFQLEERRAAREPETAVQGERKDAISTEFVKREHWRTSFDCRDDNLKKEESSVCYPAALSSWCERGEIDWIKKNDVPWRCVVVMWLCSEFWVLTSLKMKFLVSFMFLRSFKSFEQLSSNRESSSALREREFARTRCDIRTRHERIIRVSDVTSSLYFHWSLPISNQSSTSFNDFFKKFVFEFPYLTEFKWYHLYKRFDINNWRQVINPKIALFYSIQVICTKKKNCTTLKI